MTDIEVVDLYKEDDEVQVTKSLRQRPESDSLPPVKRAFLPRKCKSKTLESLCVSMAQTNLTSAAPVAEKRAGKRRPRKKAVLPPLSESEPLLVKPCQVNSTSMSPILNEIAPSDKKTVGQEQKKQSNDPDLEFIPLSAISERVEQAKQAGILDLDFIPLSGDLDAPDCEENKKPSKIVAKECSTMNEKGFSDSQEPGCSNRLFVGARSGENAEGKNSRAKARKRKERRSLQELQVLDLSSIPLPADLVNMSTPKPSLRQFIKAKRRRKSVKKRESLVLQNRGLPLNAEIVIDDDEDGSVPVPALVAQIQEDVSSPDKQRLATPSEAKTTVEAIAPSEATKLPITDEQELGEGEVIGEDEIQFICNIPGSNNGNVTSKSSSPDIVELSPIESAKKKPKKRGNNSLLNSRANLEEISILHDSSQNISAAKSRKAKKKRKKGRAAEISTQTTPSLACLAARTNNSQPTGSSPNVKRPGHLPNPSQAAAGWSSFQPYPHVPNLPFVPTVHMVPQAFNFATRNIQQRGPVAAMPTLHNPDRGNLPQVGLRPIVIDGCNVAMRHGKNTVFSVSGIQICVDYFLKLGHRVFAFVPEHYYGRKPDDPELLARLERQGHVIKTPGRIVRGRIITSYDDKYIVNYATEVGGVIVSGDKYRDLIEERWDWRITIENRLLQPTFVGNMVMFPDDPLGRFGPPLSRFLSY